MTFKERVFLAEANFLAALTSGTSALAQFDAEWEILGGEFERALDQSTIDPSEVELAYAVSSKIAILSENLLKMEEVSTSITATLLNEIDVALSDLSLQDLSLQDVQETPTGRVQPSPTAAPHRHTGPYISEAISWLLEHPHDPYPPSSLKRTWARQAQITPRVMDDWFKSIRKEIGWVALTKTHFKGSRSMAVAAAGAVLLDNDSGAEATVPFEVQAELLAVKAKLQNLYLEERGLPSVPPTHESSHTGSRSVSVESSASASSDLTPSPSSSSDRSLYSSDSLTTAPSTPSSQSSSHLPSLVFDASSDNEDDEQLLDPFQDLQDNATALVAGLAKDNNDSQRRLQPDCHSYFDLSFEDSPESRLQDPLAQFIDTQLFPPFDSLSQSDFWTTATEDVVEVTTDALAPSPLETVPTVEAVPTVQSASVPSRKRRLSDADVPATAKKSRTIRNLPKPGARRPQAVSAPVPVAHLPIDSVNALDFDQFFKELEKGTISLPPFVGDASSVGPSGPVDFNVFDFAALEPPASASIAPVCTVDAPLPTAGEWSWDTIIAAASSQASTDAVQFVDKELETLLASFTDSAASAGSEDSAEGSTATSDSTSDSAAGTSEPSTSATQNEAQTVSPEMLSMPNDLLFPMPSTSFPTSPSFQDLLSDFTNIGGVDDLGCIPSIVVS
ncbi:hypothetical protein BC835DRAFT_1419573 [Cytidiella melzeri]|nr:hypothetical protein BC835DRAFT_1419573 [Cytidiella melzeri]